jgi:Aflatoxin regulatory protein/Fungal Zn(2)-Cys(6) binuclear cluster domain
MAATPTPVTTLSPRLEASKLRSSCDGCRLAKVKCDRGRPECNRCKMFSSTCIYGTSRNAGKPRRRKPGSSRDPPIEKHKCTLRTTAHSCNSHNDTAPGFGEPQNISGYSLNNLSNSMTDISFSADLNSSFGTIEQNQFISDLSPCLPLEGWPQLGDWQQFDNFGSNPDLPSSSLLEPIRTEGKSSDEPHSCARESYEIFRDLICPAPSLHAPESNAVTVCAQLDQVLQFNRNAIDRLTKVLKCSCATSGHRAMVHASIVSRILIWYQQAAGWTGSSSGGRTSDSGSSSSYKHNSIFVSASYWLLSRARANFGRNLQYRGPQGPGCVQEPVGLE